MVMSNYWVRRQRKLRIKLGYNHFNLNFILTFNLYIMGINTF